MNGHPPRVIHSSSPKVHSPLIPIRVGIAGYGPLFWAAVKATVDAAQTGRLHLTRVYSWSDGDRATQHNEAAILTRLLASVPDAVYAPPQNGRLQSSEEIAELKQTYQLDVLIVASWGEIFKQDWLDRIYPTEVFNIHPSLLPAHRGPNPYAAAILAGDTMTGVTLHKLTPGVDEGPIIAQWPLQWRMKKPPYRFEKNWGMPPIN
jgi:folate-dependent phosphoribosylglycinamide formyltransferase PurN